MSDIERNVPNADVASSSSKKRKAYTVDKKLEIVGYAKEKKSINAASKHYNVDRASVRDWMKESSIRSYCQILQSLRYYKRD